MRDGKLDAARGVNADSINKMLGDLKAAGAQFLPSSALLPPNAGAGLAAGLSCALA